MSSTWLDSPLHVELRPSLPIGAAVVALHGAALLLLPALSLPPLVQLFLAALVLASLTRALRAHALVAGPGAVREVVAEPGGRMRVTLATGEVLAARLLPDSYLSAGLVVLVFRVPGRWRSLSAVVAGHRVDPQRFRRLRVYLRVAALQAAGDRQPEPGARLGALRERLRGLLGGAGRGLRDLLLRAPHVGRVRGPLRIILFRGFAGPGGICLPGRVAGGGAAREARRAARGAPGRGLGQRLRDAWGLLVSRPVPEARVELEVAGRRHQVTADHHGVFLGCFEGAVPAGGGLWRAARARLIQPQPGPGAGTAGEVLVPPAGARRLVVSDIDDTVVHTGVASKLRMLWNLFATGSHARVPFPGIAPFYRALHEGTEGDEGNPLLYVSRGPWSIYPLLDAFFQRHGIPAGPVLLLREWGVSLAHPWPRRARGHKRALIERILAVYPDLPVVLIGDSGQRDPEIYLDVARDHPRRVAAVYIRDLTPGGPRSRAVEALRPVLAELGADLVVADATEAMAVHAAGRGWIPRNVLPEVVRHAASDEA